MLSFLGKKKLTDNQIANIFTNAILETVDKGWPVVADFIMDSPEFIRTPVIDKGDYGKFLMIVITVNFHFLPDYFEDGHDREIIRLSIEKFADIFEMTPEEFARKVKDYKTFLKRVNAPSPKIMNSMSKGVFYKYKLVEYQEPFYSDANAYNPIFIKNLDEVMSNFIWDWESFLTKYKIKEFSGVNLF